MISFRITNGFNKSEVDEVEDVNIEYKNIVTRKIADFLEDCVSIENKIYVIQSKEEDCDYIVFDVTKCEGILYKDETVDYIISIFVMSLRVGEEDHDSFEDRKVQVCAEVNHLMWSEVGYTVY